MSGREDVVKQDYHSLLMKEVMKRSFIMDENSPRVLGMIFILKNSFLIKDGVKAYQNLSIIPSEWKPIA